MNIIEYNNTGDKELVFCILDTTTTITDPWVKELTKNQADFTLQNLFSKGYSVLQGTSEYLLLLEAQNSFKYACVLSTGTEFTNGTAGINAIAESCEDDFIVKGHILDRGDAYYELHQQCYLINLQKWRKLGMPTIGDESMGDDFFTRKPIRSEENHHDKHTPIWIAPGREFEPYKHKRHGWNIIQKSLDAGYDIHSFNDSVRNNKYHLYPESPKDFYKQIEYAYYKDGFCRTEHVHTEHTEHPNRKYKDLQQVVVPASGENYKDWLHKELPVKVVMYDYNKQSLDYWKENVERLPNVEYEFVEWDLLAEHYNICDHLDLSKQEYTLFNLSNIFCYEGTNTLYSIKYKLQKENHLINYLKEKMPAAQINFSSRTSEAFTPYNLYGPARDVVVYEIENFKCPTWHTSDWYTQ